MRILAISAGTTRLLVLERAPFRGVQSAIQKQVVSSIDAPEPIELNPLGLARDEQTDLSVHGGLDKALYAFPSEHWPVWNTAKEQPIRPGLFGENLLTEGLTEDSVFVGDQWRIGEALLQVTEPRIPCDKFCAVMGSSEAAKKMVNTGTCGWYLRVLKAAPLTAGMTIEIIPGAQEVSVASAFDFRTRRQR